MFIDQQKKTVRVLRKRAADYEETVMTEGVLALETVPGFALQVEWLFTDPLPDELPLLNDLLRDSRPQ